MFHAPECPGGGNLFCVAFHYAEVFSLSASGMTSQFGDFCARCHLKSFTSSQALSTPAKPASCVSRAGGAGSRHARPDTFALFFPSKQIRSQKFHNPRHIGRGPGRTKLYAQKNVAQFFGVALPSDSPHFTFFCFSISPHGSHVTAYHERDRQPLAGEIN